MPYDKTRLKELLLKQKTPDVLNELIIINKGLIDKQLIKFNMLHDSDAISFAYEALYKAILDYDVERGHEFSTLATVYIYNKLGCHLRNLKNNINSNTISYDNKNVGEIAFIDTFESPYTADANCLQQCESMIIHTVIKECINELNNTTHKNIINIWISSNFTATNMHIAKELNCSQSYVNQVINKFRATLKHKLKGQVL